MQDDLNNIKLMRKQIGLTQSELAMKSQVSQSLIAKIESGKLDPTFSKAKQIFEALNTSSRKATIKAKDLMQTRIISASVNETLDNVIQKMRKHEISQLPVINKYVIGLVSESSILEKVKSGKDIKSLTAGEAMAESAPMVSESTDLETVAGILKQHQMVIVSKHGELAGLITKADLLKNIYKL